MKHSFHHVARGALAASALGLALGACTLTPTGSENTYAGGGGKLELERIEGNQLLAANLKILNPVTKMQDGHQMVQFELKNTTSSTLRFAWAVDWYDADGFVVNANDRAFEPIALGGMASKAITIVAPKAGDKMQWKLHLTSPNEIH
ncbi:MAG: DUF1425 domain-containing protein [Planctomycetes bacterium]|jgi:uncharacterized protein YcfL|nr:DUF1425 domain-containing protein [Planctomycetota bacterium]